MKINYQYVLAVFNSGYHNKYLDKATNSILG